MNTKFRKLLIGLIILPLLLVLAVVVIFVFGNSAARPLPNPNGYDDFLQAAQQVTPDVGGYLNLEREDLVTLVQSNTNALRLVRAGLNRQSCLPLESVLTNTAGLTSQLAGMKHLALLLTAEGQMHEKENRFGEAALSYLDAIRFGNEMSRGGLLITRLVGIACESIGCHALVKVIPRLRPEEDRQVLAQLERIDSNRVSWAEVLESEKSCNRYHLRNHLNPVIWAVSWWNTRESVQKAEIRHKSVTAHERLLMVESALRCYQAEKGEAPTRLEELVTNYISVLPGDPFGTGPMIYRPQPGAGWALYSVGPDGVDDGGRPAVGNWPIKGDILVDSAW